MFDSFYPFRLVGHRKATTGEHFIKEYKFTFVAKNNQRYIVNVEQYKYNLYIIKFYLKAHSDSPNKFALLTGFNDAVKVINTCLEIMIYLYKLDKTASFGFIGANLLGEDKANTKRFRIYNKIMQNLFSPLKFNHYNYPEKSAYLLLNKSNTIAALLSKIERMFAEFYVFQ